MSTFTEFSKKINDEMKEKTIEESKKYRSRNEFKHGSCGAYNAARKNKWIDEMLWLNKK